MIVASLVTPFAPGAIATITLVGDVGPLLARLSRLTRRGAALTPGRCTLLPIGEVDDAVVVQLDARRALIMPHGGPRIVQRVLELLHRLGASVEEPGAVDPRDLYPEAEDEVEALMLWTLAKTESPLAIDLLLDQPRRWRGAARLSPGDIGRSARLRRLVDPPHVALVGPPNVGKSTLTNVLTGRDASIVADLPGTTRDFVTCRLELEGLAVMWHDTPGVGRGDQPLEQEALDLALRIIERADCVVAISDAGHAWPELPRPPDLRVGSRSDLGLRSDVALSVCATTGDGLVDLVRAIRERLVPEADLVHPGPWLFDQRLAGPLGRGRVDDSA